MADVQIPAPGVSAAPLVYTVPGSLEIILKTLYAEFDGSGAAGAWLPTVRILSSAGRVVGAYRTQDTVPAGDSAHVTWGSFLSPKGITVSFPRNMGELGFSGSGTLSDTYTHTIQFEDALVGDCVLVSAQAPSVSAALALPGEPAQCFDSNGAFYTGMTVHKWEASPPNVNEGARQKFFLSDPLTSPLLDGVGTITVEWDNTVFDRSIYAWLIRHDNGNPTAAEIAASANNDAAVFADTKVTLQSPSVTPGRDNGLLFATTFSAKVGGTGAFGGVIGFGGYFQALSRTFAGSKQSYRISTSTFGANALVINPFGLPFYEIDLGQLPGGVNVPAFNGVAQNYSAGANAWKGITIFSID